MCFLPRVMRVRSKPHLDHIEFLKDSNLPKPEAGFSKKPASFKNAIIRV